MGTNVHQDFYVLAWNDFSANVVSSLQDIREQVIIDLITFVGIKNNSGLGFEDRFRITFWSFHLDKKTSLCPSNLVYFKDDLRGSGILGRG